jgi:hypothetical protein
MDCLAALEAARRENRYLLKRCEVLQAELLEANKRASDWEKWANDLIRGHAA